VGAHVELDADQAVGDVLSVDDDLGDPEGVVSPDLDSA